MRPRLPFGLLGPLASDLVVIRVSLVAEARKMVMLLMLRSRLRLDRAELVRTDLSLGGSELESPDLDLDGVGTPRSRTRVSEVEETTIPTRWDSLTLWGNWNPSFSSRQSSTTGPCTEWTSRNFNVDEDGFKRNRFVFQWG